MDTGVVAIAFFGVRGHSFEDNEYRAAHVALAIVSALKRYDLRAKCGVTVGVGFCGLVGAPNRSRPASRATPVRQTRSWVALCPILRGFGHRDSNRFIEGHESRRGRGGAATHVVLAGASTRSWDLP